MSGTANASFWSQGAAATVAVVVYVVGVLVVNCDLARFGVVSLDLARPEYVMAGVLAVVLLLTAALVDMLFFAVAVAISGWFRGTLDWRDLGKRIGGYLWVALLLNAVVTALAGRLSFPKPPFLPVLDSAFLTLLLVASPVTLTIGYIRAGQSFNSIVEAIWALVLYPHRGAVGVAVLGFIVASVAGYATWVYPELARQFGGGKRPIVTVAISEPLGLIADRAGAPLYVGTDNIIGPAFLILETSDRYVLSGLRYGGWFYGGGALAIRKDLVRAVYYEGAVQDIRMP